MASWQASSLPGHTTHHTARPSGFSDAPLRTAGDTPAIPIHAGRYLDLSVLARILWPDWPGDSLASALVHCPPHPSSAGNDELPASARLLQGLQHQALQLSAHTLRQLAQTAAHLSPALAEWLTWAAGERARQFGEALPDGCTRVQTLVFHDTPEHPAGKAERTGDNHCPADLTPDGQEVAPADLLGPGGALARLLPGFQVRTGQLQMAHAVANALQSNHHLVAEAGTGTGKSLAYLVPAALHALRTQERVLVATHTVALQDQIAQRDFPLLQAVLNQPVKLAVLKGRSNYVCLRKVEQEALAVNWTRSATDTLSAMQLLVWVAQTQTGDRAEIALSATPDTHADVWPRVQSETETCISRRCPFFRPCFYFRARARAYEADVVVTNHSLVFADMRAEQRVLPRFDKIIFDEAHHLDDEASKHLGDEVHSAQMRARLYRLWRDHGRHGALPELVQRLSGSGTAAEQALPVLEHVLDKIPALQAAADAVWDALAQLFTGGHSERRLSPDLTSHPAWPQLLAHTDSLRQLLPDADRLCQRLELAAAAEPDLELSGRLQDCAGWLRDWLQQLHLLSAVCELHETQSVVWIEAAGRSETVSEWRLLRAPLDVAAILEQQLFDAKQSVILTSATLAINGNFAFAIRRFGLAGAARSARLQTLYVPSPFQLDRQALLCIPTDAPELTRLAPATAAEWLSTALCPWIELCGGRTLVLFTNHQVLRTTALAMRQPLAARGIPVLAQGVDGPRTQLLEAFRRNPHAVLLGVQSFWEGVDLPGDQLVALVIVRLPFAPPVHPLQQARSERLQAQGLNPFQHLSLPEAIVRFRQGVGRLIRTETDRGIIVVYDKRLLTARYGSKFLRALSGIPVRSGRERELLQTAAAFLSQRAD
ncbi:MAG: DEAD/DEAH box helicase family protein [Alicyclobacillus sp.]|nr:DEAD/DEAH box helicase family protein [Alicyclobacillus sp.]